MSVELKTDLCKLRIAVATARGWAGVHWYEDNAGPPILSGEAPPTYQKRHKHDSAVPDYSGDLNAMHEVLIHAYKTQPAGWASRFEDHLTEVCSRRQYPQWHTWCAEAEDLAAAFILPIQEGPA